LGRYRMLRCPALLAPVVLVSFSSGTLAELISKAAEPAGSTPDGLRRGGRGASVERLAGKKRRDQCRKSMQSRNEGVVHQTNLKFVHALRLDAGFDGCGVVRQRMA
jgi:hypothetical protein